MECFFCRFLAGEESEWNREEDVVLRTTRTTSFVAPKRWPENPGNVIVVPNEHVPDLESTPDDLLAEVFAATKRVATAMREAYGCEGTSTRQHNGVAAGQEVDHLHVHVFPRYAGDRLYERDAGVQLRTARGTREARSGPQEVSDTLSVRHLSSLS